MAKISIDALTSEIKSRIKSNGKMEITGPILQGILLDMVDTLQPTTIDGPDPGDDIGIVIEVTNPKRGDILVYQNGKWVNQELLIETIQAGRLSDLKDVEVTNPLYNGQILVYRDKAWVNEDPPTTSGGGGDTIIQGADKLADLKDVNVSSPKIGQNLQYDGSKWVPVDAKDGTWVKMTKNEYDQAKSSGTLSDNIMYIIVN